MPTARPASRSASVPPGLATRRPIHVVGNEPSMLSTRFAGARSVVRAATVLVGSSDASGSTPAVGGPRAPKATTPTNATRGDATPAIRRSRRSGERGLVGTGSTIMVWQWYVPGRPADGGPEPLLCTHGPDRGARRCPGAQLLAGDDARDARSPWQRAPGRCRRRRHRWRDHWALRR